MRKPDNSDILPHYRLASTGKVWAASPTTSNNAITTIFTAGVVVVLLTASAILLQTLFIALFLLRQEPSLVLLPCICRVSFLFRRSNEHNEINDGMQNTIVYLHGTELRIILRLILLCGQGIYVGSEFGWRKVVHYFSVLSPFRVSLRSFRQHRLSDDHGKLSAARQHDGRRPI